MSESFDVHIASLPLGAYSGAVAQPLVKMPTGGGGITVLEAHMLGPSGTAITGKLVTMTDVGTPIASGTVGSFAATVNPSGTVPAELTISDAYVAAGEWIGYDQASGTVPAGTYISLSYVMGKAG